LALLWCNAYKDNTRATPKKRKIRGRASPQDTAEVHTVGERKNVSNVSNRVDEEEAKAYAPRCGELKSNGAQLVAWTERKKFWSHI
jgi:hypothetical protein